jgi:asparagine synthase (glutamine-hydrolysing)
MCGIFTIINNSNHFDKSYIDNEFQKGKHRGPEFSKLVSGLVPKTDIGFHRLSINGLNPESNQPLIIDDVVLICNGEIYNYKELYTTMNVTPKTDSDCEVIIHLFIKYGIEQTLIMLDGVYAFILYDNRAFDDVNIKNQIFVARDPYGVRPLYALYNSLHTSNVPIFYAFASELKCLCEMYNDFLNNDTSCDTTIKHFTPGTYSVFEMPHCVNASWELIKENIPYFIPIFNYTFSVSNNIYSQLANLLDNAVCKRCATTERPIACLLSGGLDSSLIAALVNNYYLKNNIHITLETYSIGLQGSEDLKYARMVADYLETNHTEIIVTERDMFDAIPEVIHAIESYDTTTIRASIGNYLIGKYISKHSDAKVIFNGDGSDELFGGYLYMNKCPDDIEFDKETRRLLQDIHLFDVLRSDKCISSHGLEPRTPFLDRSFTNFVLSIPSSFRNHTHNKGNTHKLCEKFLLRNSFTRDYFVNYTGKDILPSSILWRKKEAFSDGVSSKGRSLYQILQEYIAHHLSIELQTIYFKPCIKTEQYYYKRIFDEYYQNTSHIIPYFWMPKYTDATDPSARTLDIYEEETSESISSE